MLRWWRGRGQADRFELYIQATLYGNIVLPPLVTAGTVATGTAPGVRAVATVLAATAHVLVCVLLLRAGIADTARPGELAVVAAGILLILVPAARITLWTLGMVRELERTRRVNADLAVAEERLRFARDMHDVLGRSLSVVAVKAELAGRFAELGRPEAANEMIEVRRIAQEALTEMSAVVGGYRSADLGTELAGARALLASAGIACRVEGSPRLSATVQGSLGWVVREGTTNVLRHSQASECVITLSADTRAVTLTVENDGTPHGSDRTPPGNGLTGLTERITALGGTVTAGPRADDRFRLEATVPVGTT